MFITSSSVAHHSTSAPPLAVGDTKSAPAFNGVVRREDIKGTWHNRLCWVGAAATAVGPLYNVIDTLSDAGWGTGGTFTASLFYLGAGGTAGAGAVHACYRAVDKVHEMLERRKLADRVMSPPDQLARLVERANRQALNANGLIRCVDDICRLQATFPESIAGDAAARAILRLNEGAFQPTVAEHRWETRGKHMAHLEVKALCRGLDVLLSRKVISPAEYCDSILQLARHIARSRSGLPKQMKQIAKHFYAALTQADIPADKQVKFVLQLTKIRAFSQSMRSASGADASRATIRSDDEDAALEVSVIGEAEFAPVVEPGDGADGPVDRDCKHTS